MRRTAEIFEQVAAIEAVEKHLYLTVDGAILDDVGGEARTYTYDPRKPVATYGGRNMAIDPGLWINSRSHPTVWSSM